MANEIKEPLIHITRRDFVSAKRAIITRVLAVVTALLVSGAFAFLLID